MFRCRSCVTAAKPFTDSAKYPGPSESWYTPKWVKAVSLCSSEKCTPACTGKFTSHKLGQQLTSLLMSAAPHEGIGTTTIKSACSKRNDVRCGSLCAAG